MNVPLKKTRKPNWGEEEMKILPETVLEHHGVLFGKFPPSLTAEMKRAAWENICTNIMSSNNLQFMKVKGICYQYLMTASCARRDCIFVHIPPSVQYMDSHCHTDLMATLKPKCRFEDLPQIPHFAGAISNFCFPKTWNIMDSDLRHCPNVWFTVGVHPKEANMFGSGVGDQVKAFLHHPKNVAVGECGLDFYHGKTVSQRQRQREVYVEQLMLAAGLNKPLVIHCRDAERETFDITCQYLTHIHKIHLHCFSGNVEDLKMWMGYFPNLKFFFTNRITGDKEKVSRSIAVIKEVPLDRILLETDAPHFFPQNLDPRSLEHENIKYSQPGHALNVAKRIADLKLCPIKDVIDTTTSNCKFIYNLK